MTFLLANTADTGYTASSFSLVQIVWTMAIRTTTRESLSEENDVWFDAIVIAAEHFTSATQSRLNLVANKEDVVFFAQCMNS
jgi:hypothetical protein